MRPFHVIAGIGALLVLGFLFWILELRLARREAVRKRKEAKRQFEMARQKAEIERAKRMLYDDMSVDEAQRVVWAWEEMSDEERKTLPLDRRVQIRQIIADLEEHRRRWGEGREAAT